MRVLLIEDDVKLAQFHRRALREEGHAVDLCRDGDDGAQRALHTNYDAIFLDVEPPGIRGRRILRGLKEQKKESTVILLGAQGALKRWSQDFDLEAGGVLIKPFTCEALLTRLRTLLRRGVGSTPTLLRCSDVTMCLESRLVVRGSRELTLTRKEFALLEYLLRNPNAVLTRRAIAEHVWGYPLLGKFTSTVLDFYVNSLRKKLGDGRSSRLIQTVRGLGYILKEAQNVLDGRPSMTGDV